MAAAEEQMADRLGAGSMMDDRKAKFRAGLLKLQDYSRDAGEGFEGKAQSVEPLTMSQLSLADTVLPSPRGSQGASRRGSVGSVGFNRSILSLTQWEGERTDSCASLSSGAKMSRTVSWDLDNNDDFIRRCSGSEPTSFVEEWAKEHAFFRVCSGTQPVTEVEEFAKNEGFFRACSGSDPVTEAELRWREGKDFVDELIPSHEEGAFLRRCSGTQPESQEETFAKHEGFFRRCSGTDPVTECEELIKNEGFFRVCSGTEPVTELEIMWREGMEDGFIRRCSGTEPETEDEIFCKSEGFFRRCSGTMDESETEVYAKHHGFFRRCSGTDPVTGDEKLLRQGVDSDHLRAQDLDFGTGDHISISTSAPPV